MQDKFLELLVHELLITSEYGIKKVKELKTIIKLIIISLCKRCFMQGIEIVMKQSQILVGNIQRHIFIIRISLIFTSVNRK